MIFLILVYTCRFQLLWKQTNKQTYLRIVMFNQQAFEASASSSGGKQTLIDFDFFHHNRSSQVPPQLPSVTLSA